MKYIIDTDIIISVLKKQKKWVELFESIDQFDRGSSVICIGEVLEGLTDQQQIQLAEFFGSLKIYDVNLDVVFKFAELRKNLRKQGNLIENMDLLIAATCLVNKLTLITGNVKHFQRVPGLKILRI